MESTSSISAYGAGWDFPLILAVDRTPSITRYKVRILLYSM